MKKFQKMAAQGDLLITKIDTLPGGLREVEAENGVHVIAHSETGHHHVMEAKHVRVFQPEKADIYQLFLGVSRTTVIEHKRSFDTHKPISVSSGNYVVRRQREHTPEGFRRVAD